MEQLKSYYCEAMSISITRIRTNKVAPIIEANYSLEHRHPLRGSVGIDCAIPFEVEAFIHGQTDQELSTAISQIVVSGYNRDCIEKTIVSYHGDYSIIIRTLKGIIAFCSLESTLPLFFKNDEESMIVSSDHMYLIKDVVDSLDINSVTHAIYGDSVFPFSGIQLLNAGEYLIALADQSYSVSLGQVQEASNSKIVTKNRRPFDDVVADFHEIFPKSLYNLAKGSNRIGLLLSGGIDSALIAYYLRQLSFDVVLYTWSAPSLPQTDEWNDAHLVAEITGFPHKRLLIDGDALFERVFLLDGIDIPFFHNYSGAWLASCEQMVGQVSLSHPSIILHESLNNYHSKKDAQK